MGLSTIQILKILNLRGVGRRTAFAICENAGHGAIENDNDLYDLIQGCIANNKIRTFAVYDKNTVFAAFSKAEETLQKSFTKNIKVLSFFEKDFPVSLKAIEDPPILLHLKGDYNLLNKLTGVAIIGTREPTIDGVKSGEYFGKLFGINGFNVVSGLAKGCDASAHRGCLKAKGFTTAILAHGLHTIYPKENKSLADEIIDAGGVLLSEYSLGTGALANYFVERDRLQAGLSTATIVIQTGIKGGTMHAVNATLNSRKILAAVKYKANLDFDKIIGNNTLIKNNQAFPLTSDNYLDLIEMIMSTSIHKKNDIKEPFQEISTKKRGRSRKSKTTSTDQYKLGF
jgi:DNA processing protein